MTPDELRNQVDRAASVWWAQHAPLGDLPHHAFVQAVLGIVDAHAGPELERLRKRVAELEAFAGTLWEHSRFQAVETSECNDPDHAAWAKELIETAKRLGVDAAVDAAIKTTEGA